MIELKREGIAAFAQSPINVLYDGKIIGEYFTDILARLSKNPKTKHFVFFYGSQVLDF